MNHDRFVEAVIASRRTPSVGQPARHKAEAEGGCGVIGMAASVPLPGRHLLQSLIQMRNRGNGKGGGIAAAGLAPEAFGVSAEVLANDYLLAVALLDAKVRQELERRFIAPTFVVDHIHRMPMVEDWRALPGVEVAPPDVMCYFVRVRPEVRGAFAGRHDLADLGPDALDDEIVYQNSYALNRAFYASTGDKRAFVLSHGKDLLVLKLVAYGDDAVRAYKLEDFLAHVWIGHHRYPTKGRVWHPGGAHPFIGMHEALVHNGDFANYASISSYLAQRNIAPLFLTDTEVAVLVFDLLHRTYGYPLEYVIEAMAPTTERDFAMLPAEKRSIYRMLQTVHMHASPDGPWFFLIAGTDPATRACRLIGITDTSMLRPQVFALQRGEAAVGFAASERQGIDAALASLAAEDARFWAQPDLTWNARGGSYTDGGAFVFTVIRDGAAPAELVCTDKFGRVIDVAGDKLPPTRLPALHAVPIASIAREPVIGEGAAAEVFAHASGSLPVWGYEGLAAFLSALIESASGRDSDNRRRAIEVLTLLRNRRLPTGAMKRSGVVSLVDGALAAVFDGIRRAPDREFLWAGHGTPLPAPHNGTSTLVLDARGFPPEGNSSLARAVVAACRQGYARLIVCHAQGHRFIGSGLGVEAVAARVDVYGASGDYLASGIDGAEIFVHGTGQDQLAQIMKDGKLVVHGDVGQTFGYAAKGGSAFVLGNAAGRPLINAVGKPRVVINGTCLDYLAESFMAGDPLTGGGFVIVNGVRVDDDGAVVELDTPYPGGNLFALASGGAIYLRDPRGRVGEDQLNGGAFVALSPDDVELIVPYLRENEQHFGISVEHLLSVDGRRVPAERAYRKIAPSGHKALLPEEAWVRKEA